LRSVLCRKCFYFFRKFFNFLVCFYLIFESFYSNRSFLICICLDFSNRKRSIFWYERIYILPIKRRATSARVIRAMRINNKIRLLFLSDTRKFNFYWSITTKEINHQFYHSFLSIYFDDLSFTSSKWTSFHCSIFSNLHIRFVFFTFFCEYSLKFSSSSPLTGTGTVPAPRNHVTFGVLRTIYQLSFVTTMRTRIYPGNIFFFFLTFTPPARTETESWVGTKTSRIWFSRPNASRRCIRDCLTFSSVPEITRITYHSHCVFARRSNIILWTLKDKYYLFEPVPVFFREPVPVFFDQFF